jgi:hypothetical protein
MLISCDELKKYVKHDIVNRLYIHTEKIINEKVV